MKVSVSEEMDEETARAIAEALASRFRDDVTVVSADGEELGRASYDGAAAIGGSETATEAKDELGPTEREMRLWAEIEDINAGGKEKYKKQLPEQGKLFVRDRIDLWFNPEQSSAGDGTASGSEDGFLFEDGRFAEFDSDDVLPADGMVTGGAEFEGRNVHFMANDYTVKR